MQKILPFIWFEDQAREAAEWYVSIFPESRIISEALLPNTPSGDTRVVSLVLNGTEFQFMSAGKLSDRNPSFSYMVACKDVQEVERLWASLATDAEVLMPLDTYPFSEKYGWLKDRYGVSWQIMHDGGMNVARISPCLMFVGDVCGRAEEAMNAYVALFGGEVFEGHVSRYSASQPPDKEGTLNYARFKIGGTEIVVMDSALNHQFRFNEMQSLVVRCQDQEEMDRLSDSLSAFPEAEQCGWVKDTYGVSWQMTTPRMEEMMTTGTPEQMARIVETFLPMKRLDIEKIEQAFRGV